MRTLMAMAVQATKGEELAAATERVALWGGTSPGPDKTMVPDDSASIQRLPVTAYPPPVRPTGDPELLLRPNVIGLLMYGALGAKSVSGAGDPFTHVFTPALSQPWLTFWRSIGTLLNERMTDCKIVALRITSQAGLPVRVTASILGGWTTYFDDEEASVDVEVDDHAMHWHGTGAYLVDGVAVAAIDEWEVLIATGATPRDTLAAYDVRDGARLTVTAKVSQVIADAATWNSHLYASPTPTDGSTTDNEGGYSPASGLSFKVTPRLSPERSLKIEIPRPILVSPSWGAVDTRGRPVREQATYQAYKVDGSDPGVIVTLKNARSAY